MFDSMWSVGKWAHARVTSQNLTYLVYLIFIAAAVGLILTSFAIMNHALDKMHPGK